MVFAVNALPTVRIVVSDAENITRGEDLTAMDLDPMERMGNLVMEYTTGDDNVKSVVLFCGYVLTETPALAVSISSMRSTISYQLVCAAGAISSIPYGGLEYYSLGGDSTNNLRSTPYSALIPFEEMQNKGAWTALNKDFQPSPPTALAKMLDILRRNFAKDDKSMTPLLNIFVDGCGGLSIKPITGSMLMPTMAHQCIPALRGSPPLTIFLSLLRQVYLGFFPQTVGERNTPCKLVTAPLNPWSNKQVDEDHIITAKEILSVQAQTQYQLDQRIDYWVVKSQLLPNLIAAYNKYKDCGLQVLGIAVWEEPDESLKVIAEKNIPYPQILGVSEEITNIYGINAVPHIILFAPDGTILARGLRGEEIEKRLEGIFHNNK